MIRPVEDAVIEVPKIVVKDSAVNSVCHGSRLGVNGVVEIEETVKEDSLAAVMTIKGELVALGRAIMDAEQMKDAWEGDAVATDAVVMARDAYPAGWKKKKHK